MSDKHFTIARTFDAPRALVWRAWTDPTLAARWWHPRDVEVAPGSVHIDLRADGTYSYTMVDGDGATYPTAGRYLTLREPEHLRFAWGQEEDGDAALVISVDLEDQGGRTRMTFRLDGIEPGSDDHGVHGGWTSAFDILDEVIEDLRAGSSMRQAR